MVDVKDLYNELIGKEGKRVILNNADDSQRMHSSLTRWADSMMNVDLTLDKMLETYKSHNLQGCEIIIEHLEKDESIYLRLDHLKEDDELPTAPLNHFRANVYLKGENIGEAVKAFEKESHVLNNPEKPEIGEVYEDGELYCIDVEGLDKIGYATLKYNQRFTFRTYLTDLAHKFVKLMGSYKEEIHIIGKGGELKDITALRLMNTLGSENKFTIKGRNTEEITKLYDLVERYHQRIDFNL